MTDDKLMNDHSVTTPNLLDTIDNIGVQKEIKLDSIFNCEEYPFQESLDVQQKWGNWRYFHF